MVLDKIVVLECAGLAPAPFAGLIQVLKEEGIGLMLANAGADVIRIDRPNSAMDDVLAQSALHLSFMGVEGSARSFST
jgi:crotonobetainyl-CoA:carnitine CoA-transferase CaiB-like acyl-CoA transferase